jgi:hypothetical protein
LLPERAIASIPRAYTKFKLSSINDIKGMKTKVTLFGNTIEAS